MDLKITEYVDHVSLEVGAHEKGSTPALEQIDEASQKYRQV